MVEINRASKSQTLTGSQFAQDGVYVVETAFRSGPDRICRY
jgi:hypothetical protein